MKKFIAASAALLIFLVVLSGCAGDPAASSAAIQQPIKMDAVSAFKLYGETKSKSFDRLLDTLSPYTDLYMQYSDKFLPAAMSELPIIALKAMGNDETELKNIEAMGYLNFKSVKTESGYDMSYTAPDGGEYNQTCVYDPTTDYMQSVITDAQGTVTAFFEYIKTDKAYVSQYYFDQQGDKTLIKEYVGDPNTVACGTEPAENIPESIKGGSSLGIDFVKNESIYFLIGTQNFTICEYGEETTYPVSEFSQVQR